MLNLLIILDEKNEKEENYLSYKISEEDELGHLGALIKFNEDYNLNIDNIDKMTSYDASLEVAKKGFINIHVTDRFMLIYLPMFLTDNQEKWLKDNMGLMSKFRLSISSHQIDGSFKSLKNELEEKNYSKLNDLKREIKRKKLLKEIYKKDNKKVM